MVQLCLTALLQRLGLHNNFDSALLFTDRKFGLKVQKAEATDVILSLTRQNLGHHLNLTHCLWVLRVCASNGEYLGFPPFLIMERTIALSSSFQSN